jgi:hypothetical protein
MTIPHSPTPGNTARRLSRHQDCVAQGGSAAPRSLAECGALPYQLGIRRHILSQVCSGTAAYSLNLREPLPDGTYTVKVGVGGHSY